MSLANDFVDEFTSLEPGETMTYFIGRLGNEANGPTNRARAVKELAELVLKYGTAKGHPTRPIEVGNVKYTSQSGLGLGFLTQKRFDTIFEYSITKKK